MMDKDATEHVYGRYATTMELTRNTWQELSKPTAKSIFRDRLLSGTNLTLDLLTVSKEEKKWLDVLHKTPEDKLTALDMKYENVARELLTSAVVAIMPDSPLSLSIDIEILAWEAAKLEQMSTDHLDTEVQRDINYRFEHANFLKRVAEEYLGWEGTISARDVVGEIVQAAASITQSEISECMRNLNNLALTTNFDDVTFGVPSFATIGKKRSFTKNVNDAKFIFNDHNLPRGAAAALATTGLGFLNFDILDDMVDGDEIDDTEETTISLLMSGNNCHIYNTSSGKKYIKYDNNTFYYGGTNARFQRHGIGYFADPTGFRYSGEFDNDSITGRGVMWYREYIDGKHVSVEHSGWFMNGAKIDLGTTLHRYDGKLVCIQVIVWKLDGALVGYQVTNGYAYFGKFKNFEGEDRFHGYGVLYERVTTERRVEIKIHKGMWNNGVCAANPSIIGHDIVNDSVSIFTPTSDGSDSKVGNIAKTVTTVTSMLIKKLMGALGQREKEEVEEEGDDMLDSAKFDGYYAYNEFMVRQAMQTSLFLQSSNGDVIQLPPT